MKPYFSKFVVQSGETNRTLPPCNCLRVVSVSGSVTVQFDGGDPITLVTGDRYKADWPMRFEKILVTAASGASATILYGEGDTGSATSTGGATGGTVQATTGSPEGVVDASLGQWAYDTAASALYINPATSGLTGWVLLIS